MSSKILFRLKSFGRLVVRVVQEFTKQLKEHQLPLVASSLSYTTILSIIPLLAVSFSIFQAFGGLDKVYNAVEPFILENLAEGTSEEVIGVLRGYIGKAHAGAIGIGGLIGLVFTSMSMLSSVENAFHHIWKTPNTRTLFQRIAYYWLFITLGPLALAVVVGLATSFKMPLSDFLPTGTMTFIIGAGLFTLIYKYVPHCRVRWMPALISGTVAAVFWALARGGYSLYTRKVITYSKIYGSLGAVPILLLWVFIAWLIILSGAAMTAALQKRTELK